MRTTMLTNDGPRDIVTSERRDPQKWYLVRTAFHGGGIVSWHRSSEAAERRARRELRGNTCLCGCLVVVSGADIDNLRCHTDSNDASPYRPAL